MLDPDVSFIAGARDLAVALDKLTIDGQPLFRQVTATAPRLASTGGHDVPPRIKLEHGRVVVDFYALSQVQRIICHMVATSGGTEAITVVSALIKRFWTRLSKQHKSVA